VSAHTVKQLRAASAMLATEEGADRASAGLEPIRKRLLAALVAQAFPDAPACGLTYPEECKDISKWLLNCATAHEEESDLRLLATAGAWVAAERRGDNSLAVVRAIAAYFVNLHGGVLADLVEDDALEAATQTINSQGGAS
jgi:hypothetical protein